MEKSIHVCNLCKKKYYGEIGKCFYNSDNEFKVYCKKCSSNVENMSKLPEVMIIPIMPTSFEFVKKHKLYFHPSSYGRKGGKYVAFYISQPISAITHIAKVNNILKNQNPKDYLKDIEIEDNIKSIKVYLLERLEKLSKPILKEKSSPIQGTHNSTLKKIRNSKNLKELFSR